MDIGNSTSWIVFIDMGRGIVAQLYSNISDLSEKHKSFC